METILTPLRVVSLGSPHRPDEPGWFDLAVEHRDDAAAAHLVAALVESGLAPPGGHLHLGAGRVADDRLIASLAEAGGGGLAVCGLGCAPVPPSAGPDEPGWVEFEVVDVAHRRVVRLDRPGAFIVGRDPGCDLVVGDPAVSRRHLRLVVSDGERDGVSVEDLGSSHGTRVAGRSIEGPAVVATDDAVAFGDSHLIVRTADSSRREERVAIVETVPASASASLPERWVFPDPPVLPGRARFPLWSTLVPALAALGLGAGMVASGESALWGVGFLALSPLWSIAAHADARRARRGEVRSITEAYDAALDELARQRDAVVDAARVAWAGPQPVTRPTTIRVGVGSVPAPWEIRTPSGAAPVGVDERWTRLADAPMFVDPSAGPIGVTGPVPLVSGCLRSIVVQIVTANPDTRVMVACSEPRRSLWDGLKWLPGQRDRARTAMSVVSGAAAVERGADALIAGPGGPALFVVDVDMALDAGAWSHLRRCVAAVPGLAVVVCGGDLDRDTPIATHLDLRGDEVAGARLAVRSRISAVAVDGLAADLVDGVQFDRWCRAAAAEAPRDAGGDRGVDLRDLVDEPPPVQVPVPQGRGELTAAIGMHDGALVEVDMERDGPHVLIAGTTGSGKSALLQTLAIGLAARTPPSRLQFLLVDYKGGAAFAGCGRLPHTAGVVTDLDAAGTTRVLGSLRSELRRRERVLAEAGCADLPALRRRVGAEAPPSLVVFVDEFAAMVDASPDVVAGLIDIARRGRSLGLHLVLATQRPAGAIGADIRTNIGACIALRVAEAADSIDVIGTPAAAALAADRPGAGLIARPGAAPAPFRTANPDLRLPSRRRDRRPGVRLHDFSATRAIRAEPWIGSGALVFDGVIDALVARAGRSGEARPPVPWVPALPRAVAMAWGRTAALAAGTAWVGMLDDVAGQCHRDAVVDLDEIGSLGVYGMSGAGVSGALAALALGASVGRDPATIRVDVIEMGRASLEWMEGFPQVGSVVVGADVERVGRLIHGLDRELDERSRAQRGPRRVLVLDGMAAFLDRFDRVEGGHLLRVIERVAGEGRALGLHLLVGAVRPGVLGPTLLGVLGGSMSLRSATSEGWFACGAVGPPPDLECGPGAGEWRGLRLQVGDARSGAEAVAEAERERWAGRHAQPVPCLPTVVSRASLRPTRGLDGIPIGVRLDTLDHVSLDLRAANLLVCGPAGSGRTSALRSIGNALAVCPGVRVVAGLDGPGADAGLASLLDGVTDAKDVGDRVVIVDDLDRLTDDRLDALDRLVAAGGSVRVVAAVDVTLARRSYGGVVDRLRRDRHALLLSPEHDLDGDLVGVRLPSSSTVAAAPGRGVLAFRGRCTPIQVALDAG